MLGSQSSILESAITKKTSKTCNNKETTYEFNTHELQQVWSLATLFHLVLFCSVSLDLFLFYVYEDLMCTKCPEARRGHRILCQKKLQVVVIAMWGAGNRTQVLLQEEPVFLTKGPSLQPFAITS